MGMNLDRPGALEYACGIPRILGRFDSRSFGFLDTSWAPLSWFHMVGIVVRQLQLTTFLQANDFANLLAFTNIMPVMFTHR